MNLLQGPSFKSLYIFSVSARQLNFSRAADELCITPSAVSHQIKRLEQTLGCKLFDKDGKQLVLTAVGQTFAQTLIQGFGLIHEATRQITERNDNIINLGVNSAFAVKRLTPVLGSWQQQYPQLDLRLQMINCEDDLAQMDFDMVLAGQLNHDFYDSEFICEESYHPVCSRAMSELFGNKSILQILSSHRLIDLNGVNVWQLWCNDKGIEPLESQHNLHFSHTLLMVEATLAGQGIALLDRQLIKNELQNGDLVLLDENGYIPPGSGYYISCHTRHRRKHSIENLQRWIRRLLC